MTPCFEKGDTQGVYMGVSKNRGTPKSSILIGFSLINHLFWVPLFLETPIYIYIFISQYTYKLEKNDDSIRDPFIPKRGRSRFTTFDRSRELAIPKRSPAELPGC